MHRDRAIGICLIVVCLAVVPVYLLLVLFPAQFLHFFGMPVGFGTGIEVRIYAALVPVIVGVVALLVAGAWIGISILTSPAPKESEKKKPPDNIGT